MFSNTGLYAAVLLSVTLQGVVSQTSSTGSTSTGTTSGTTPANTTGTASTSTGSAATILTSGLSTGCQTAAGGLMTSDFGSCANIIGLVSVIGAQGSVLPPLTSWISGVCSSSPCSESTLSSASASISSACSADIQKGVAAAVALNTVVSNYNPVRNMLCTQYTSNSTFCLPSVLGNIQTATGKNVTVTEVAGIVTSGLHSSMFAGVPSSTYCNDCGHALVTQSAAIPTNSSTSSSSASTSNATASASAGVASTCGASFTDGKIPSTVRVASKDSAQSGAKSGAGMVQVSKAHVVAAGLLGAIVALCIV